MLRDLGQFELAGTFARLYRRVRMHPHEKHLASFMPAEHNTKPLAFQYGLRQCPIYLIRVSHGASSSKKVYGSSFLPSLHDGCMVFDKTLSQGGNND
jgi:hypothetical protein